MTQWLDGGLVEANNFQVLHPSCVDFGPEVLGRGVQGFRLQVQGGMDGVDGPTFMLGSNGWVSLALFKKPTALSTAVINGELITRRS